MGKNLNGSLLPWEFIPFEKSNVAEFGVLHLCFNCDCVRALLRYACLILSSWQLRACFVIKAQTCLSLVSSCRPANSLKEKKSKNIYIAPLYSVSLKALRHGSHSFTCKLHHACLSFVSVHQMAPTLPL